MNQSNEYQFSLSGELPKSMTLCPNTGAMTYYARNSDAYRNLSHARKVHWLRVKKWPLWPLTDLKVE